MALEVRLARKIYGGLTVMVHHEGQPEHSEEGQQFLFAGHRGGNPEIQDAWEAFEKAVKAAWDK